MKKTYGLGVFTTKDIDLEATPSKKSTYTYMVQGDADVQTTYKDNTEKIKIKVKTKATISMQTNLEDDTHKHEVTIIAEPNSEVKVIDRHNGKAKLHLHKTNIEVQQAAKLTHMQMQDTPNTQQYNKREIKIHKDATVILNEILLNSAHTRSRTNIHLEQENAEVIQNTAYVANKDQEIDLKAEIYHNANKTKSKRNVRGTIDDTAKVILRGNINIDKTRKDCVGLQDEKTLLLNKEAKISAIPSLEIANNAVQCAHASSISRISEEKLFYMMSRGLTKNQAKEQMVSGFTKPLYENCSENIKERINNIIQEKIA